MLSSPANKLLRAIRTMSTAPQTSASSRPALPPARPYGIIPADLAVDFDHPDRAALTTRLLARCAADESLAFAAREEAAWDLPVSTRIARLLRILELTTDDPALAVALRCPHANCGHSFEIALPFAALAAEAHKDDSAGRIVSFPTGDAAPLAFRLPTGRDLVAWRRHASNNPSDGLGMIVRSLAAEPAALVELSSEQLTTLAAAMEAADPLVAFTVETSCPHCQRNATLDVDLEAVALRELGRIRRKILRDVHALATRYGWTEADVLAIPPRRRAEYRRMIADADNIFP